MAQVAGWFLRGAKVVNSPAVLLLSNPWNAILAQKLLLRATFAHLRFDDHWHHGITNLWHTDDSDFVLATPSGEFGLYHQIEFILARIGEVCNVWSWVSQSLEPPRQIRSRLRIDC